MYSNINVCIQKSLLERVCMQFSLREHDYVIDDRKIGGNAQTITKNRWVHHTSFLWRFNPSNMLYLQVCMYA